MKITHDTAVPTVAAQATPTAMEAGIPLIGELLWPKANHKALNSVLYWQVDTPRMLPNFPVGTVLGMKRITSRKQLALGHVYLFNYTICAGSAAEHKHQVFGRLIKTAYGRMWLEADNYLGGDKQVACWLSWKDDNQQIYEVSHYVTLGKGEYVMEKKTKQTSITQLVSAKYETEIFNGKGVRVSLHFGRGRTRSAVVGLSTVVAIGRLVCKDFDRRNEEAEAKLAGIQLLSEAKNIVQKGGQAL